MRDACRRWGGTLVAVLALAGTGTVYAQGLAADAVAVFGGRYAIDCAKADSPRVVVEPRQMRIEQGEQRLTVDGLTAAHAYFGNQPPPGFRVALLGQVRGRHDVAAVVSADSRGQYLMLDGDRTVMANLGPLTRAQFRHCNEVANRQAAEALRADRQAEAAAMAPVAAGSATHPSELIRDPRFKPAYLRALGPLAREPWLARMHGPAPELSQRRIGGVDYTVAAYCKPRDCGDHNAVLLYDAAQGRVYGLVHQLRRQQSFGSPPPEILRELGTIWRTEWRQGR